MNRSFANVEDLLALKASGQTRRLGAIFRTRENVYFYDTGTGKAIQLEPLVNDFFVALFDEDASIETARAYWAKIPGATQEEVLSYLRAEKLLQCPSLTSFSINEDLYDESKLKFQQLILEVTGMCNLRCRYCIYNDYNEGNRDFNTSNMTFETAKKAMDYGYAHHDTRFAVTFYGGEPLVNFPLMRQCIDYSLASMKDCELTFSFTTNLTLMSSDIAEYLAAIPGMNIVLSIDGPEDIHNAARVYANDRPTFQDVMRGLQNLSAALKKHPENHVGITVNSVFAPPYSVKKLDRINRFFSALEQLPDYASVRISYPSPGTIPESLIRELEEAGTPLRQSQNPLVEWLIAQSAQEDLSESTKNLYRSSLQDILSRVHNRMLLQEPYPVFHQNGCCVPGQRRLYITTDGQYKVCERIGDSPSIGNVDSGLDLSAIKKYYIDDYAALSIPKCAECWAVRLCSLCFANCMTPTGLDIDKKDALCVSVRDSNKAWLSLYYQLMEDSPDKLEFLKELVIS